MTAPAQPGHTVRSIRAVLGLDQAAVAKKAKVSTRTYADFESGDTSVQVGTVAKIATAFTRLGFSISTAELIEAAEREHARRAGSVA